MAPKEKQTIEIEKTHRDPLLSFNQAVTVGCSDFLGTALVPTIKNIGCGAVRFNEVGRINLGSKPIVHACLPIVPVIGMVAPK